ncbi:MAG TPA: DsbE family thiol:disulfide interchange protein [Caulobacteraceae bacterium]|nr:DsbE family thiol:disulfide interchange protein [Caulobacteraceae bacterium]
MMRWVALLPLAVLGLLAALFAGYGLRHDPKVMPAALVGKPLPDLVLPPLSGGAPERVRAKLSGPTFVNVFASWCVPCAVEAPALAAMKDQGARIVGVAYKDEPAASNAFLRRYGDPFATVLVDRDGRAGIELGVSGVPETFLVGADGVILAKHSGPLLPADAEALLEKAQHPRARPG